MFLLSLFPIHKYLRRTKLEKTRETFLRECQRPESQKVIKDQEHLSLNEQNIQEILHHFDTADQDNFFQVGRPMPHIRA